MKKRMNDRVRFDRRSARLAGQFTRKWIHELLYGEYRDNAKMIEAASARVLEAATSAAHYAFCAHPGLRQQQAEVELRNRVYNLLVSRGYTQHKSTWTKNDHEITVQYGQWRDNGGHRGLTYSTLERFLG